MSDPSAGGLSTPEGLQFARDLLRPRIPHDMHDYILKGICKAVDGTPVLAVAKTGGGKSGYFYGYILLLQALKSLEVPCQFLRRRIPDNPVMVVIFPTKGLEEEMEGRFRALNIPALALNKDTLAAARCDNRDLWKQCISEVSIMLLSPELLSSQPFDRLLQNKAFTTRLCALGIDEAHLVQDWGDSSFRESFRHIGLVHARMPRQTTLIAVTATLLAGDETSELVSTLGLKPQSFFFQRRSNIRYDVQDIYRTLRHGLTGWSFPDLDWILDGNRKTIIYGPTIALGFHLRVYYYHRDPKKRVRLYNSLCFTSYNTETRRLFLEDPDFLIIIATDTLVVGINFPNVADVVDLDPRHPNHGKQCKGRAGRPGGDVEKPCGITYVTKATMDKAKKMVENRPSDNGGKWVDGGLHIGMAQLLTGSCYRKQENILYDNPTSEPPCSCNTCVNAPPVDTTLCNCSKCCPEPVLPPLTRAKTRQSLIPMALRLTKEMTELGRARLESFRWDLWNRNRKRVGHLPPIGFLPNKHIKILLDNFARLDTASDLGPYLHDVYPIQPYIQELFNIIEELCNTFASMPRPERRKPAAKIILKGPIRGTTECAAAPVSSPLVPISEVQPTYDSFWSTFRQPLQQVPVQGTLSVQSSQHASRSGDIARTTNLSKRRFPEEPTPGVSTPLSPRKTRSSK